MVGFMVFYIIYIVLMGIVTFILYAIDGLKPTKRISAVVMIILPILGGAFGASLANYFFNTNFKHLDCRPHKALRFIPGIFSIIYGMILFILICIIRSENSIHSGITFFSVYFVIINVVTFVLQIIKTAEYHFLSSNKNGIPLVLIVILFIFGGAPAALIVNILFNFKYNNTTNCREGFNNFMYGPGVWLFSVLWIIGINVLNYYFN